MHSKRYKIFLAILIVCLIGLTLPAPARADGFIVPSDPEVWAYLQESQQIAVIGLDESQRAQIDLFISMQDRSGQSHTVTFFLPLGYQSADFSAVEMSSLEFDQAFTASLDNILENEQRRQNRYKTAVLLPLLAGGLLVNGAWSWPAWLAIFTSSCAGVSAPPSPLTTLKTESSQVSIYGLDQTSDVAALISATGLDPRVQATLEGLRGQQVAVVELQTKPLPASGQESSGESNGQLGLHLGWSSQLVEQDGEMVYTYPLDTGRAWAYPIPLTRIYIQAPSGIDFRANFPTLGKELPGGTVFGTVRQLISQVSQGEPAYAVENSVTELGRVGRITYLYSNASQDLQVTRLSEPSAGTTAQLRRLKFQQWISWFTWPLSLVLAGLIWTICWRLVMGWILQKDYKDKKEKWWKEALGWAFLYPGVIVLAIVAVLVVGLILVWLFDLLPRLQDVLLPITAIILLGITFIVAAAGINILLFSRRQARQSGVSRWRAAGAYALVVLLSNLVYLPLAVGYAALVGAL